MNTADNCFIVPFNLTEDEEDKTRLERILNYLTQSDIFLCDTYKIIDRKEDSKNKVRGGLVFFTGLCLTNKALTSIANECKVRVIVHKDRRVRKGPVKGFPNDIPTFSFDSARIVISRLIQEGIASNSSPGLCEVDQDGLPS